MKDITEKLKGKYDKNKAIVSIFAGAGGVDAQDWAEMLLKMYLKFSQKQNWKTEIVHIKEGKEAGIKNATLLVNSPFAFGCLKGESGVHRLVRLSPFSANHLRHTSFALAEVIPQIEKTTEIKINPQDLKIETYRAGGPGGQYVNKTESAVRLTHLPTSIVVACQGERLQGENKRKAMEILLSKLHQLMEKKQKKEISELRGESMAIEWGSQIRSYVLQPYQMVKDHRTGVKSSRPEDVLNGGLEKFIEGNILKLKI